MPCRILADTHSSESLFKASVLRGPLSVCDAVREQRGKKTSFLMFLMKRKLVFQFESKNPDTHKHSSIQ